MRLHQSRWKGRLMMILIIGGLGFIGAAVGRFLLEQGEQVLLTRRRTMRIPPLLAAYGEDKLKVVDCDVLDLPRLIEVIKKYAVSSIVHTAVATPAKDSLYQMFKTDLEGTTNVLEATRVMGLEKVTFTSSNTVHKGIRGEARWNESMPIPLDPGNPIGSIKIACEAVCHLYANHYGLDVVIARPSQIYGPFQASGFAPIEKMIEGAIAGTKVVLSHVDPGEYKDFLYIDDCARAMGLLHRGKTKHRVYNVASGRRETWGQAAAIVRRLIPGSEIELTGKAVASNPPGVDISRIYDEFGFKPEIGLEEGIGTFVRWVGEALSSHRETDRMRG
jgi:UDP-glucose 4-epimerase